MVKLDGLKHARCIQRGREMKREGKGEVALRGRERGGGGRGERVEGVVEGGREEGREGGREGGRERESDRS
jgi:hypothetical protein